MQYIVGINYTVHRVLSEPKRLNVEKNNAVFYAEIKGNNTGIYSKCIVKSQKLNKTLKLKRKKSIDS